MKKSIVAANASRSACPKEHVILQLPSRCGKTSIIQMIARSIVAEQGK